MLSLECLQAYKPMCGYCRPWPPYCLSSAPQFHSHRRLDPIPWKPIAASRAGPSESEAKHKVPQWHTHQRDCHHPGHNELGTSINPHECASLLLEKKKHILLLCMSSCPRLTRFLPSWPKWSVTSIFHVLSHLVVLWRLWLMVLECKFLRPVRLNDKRAMDGIQCSHLSARVENVDAKECAKCFGLLYGVFHFSKRKGQFCTSAGCYYIGYDAACFVDPSLVCVMEQYQCRFTIQKESGIPSCWLWLCLYFHFIIFPGLRGKIVERANSRSWDNMRQPRNFTTLTTTKQPTTTTTWRWPTS